MTKNTSEHVVNNMGPNDSCRLCGGNTRKTFDKRLLNKYTVGYYLCAICESLQTEHPYWIQEAYQANLASLDTGAAQRNIDNLARTYILCRSLNITNVIDIGGGDGLLCRLLRDRSINCFSSDKYAKNIYNQGFEKPNFKVPDLVIAFELIEHFATPKNDMADLFRLNPKYILISTGIYSQQNSNWWYLTPNTGQHIFFYSKASLKYIADNFGYKITFLNGYILFHRKRMRLINELMMKVLFRPPFFNLLKGFIFMSHPNGYSEDYNLIEKNFRDLN